jgi:glycosyltransferase involved in cell wall biosynthesis
MKNIYHLSENTSNTSGGLRPVIINLDNYLNNSPLFSSSVITNFKEKNDKFQEFVPSKLKAWNYSPELKNYIISELDNIDIFHLHGTFMHTQFIGSKIALANKKPYAITPHGMLEPWHLNDKKFKKSIYMSFFLNKILKKSNLLHAITPIEKENLYNLTGHKNIFEIPNLIHTSNFQFETFKESDENYLLFLSRIHPKKGLDILVEAMSRIDDKKIKLKVVGHENEYSNELKRKCVSLQIEDRVEFLGGVFGDEKYSLFKNARAFVLPSYTEAIGMVNLEAAICETPVLTTFNTGIKPEWSKHGGLMINPNVEELIKALNEITNWTALEISDRGKMMKNYVITDYSWENKGYLWEEFYNSI